MPVSPKSSVRLAWAALALIGISLAACAPLMRSDEIQLTLSGSQEVPPVTTAASGSGVIVINPDRTVSGSVTTTGITAAAAHIHVGPAGKNGPIIIPLTRTGERGWAVPAAAKLTDEQYERYKSGELYVNVHSKAHPGGEIRAQIRPGSVRTAPSMSY